MIGTQGFYKATVPQGHTWYEYQKMSHGYNVFKVHIDGSITIVHTTDLKSRAAAYAQRANERLTIEAANFIRAINSDADKWLPKRLHAK